MKKIKKKKAFIGAIISTLGAIGGAIGQGIKANKDAALQEQQHRNQQGEIYKQEAFDLANILTQEANSQDYVQQMKNRISIDRLGGQHKTKRIKKKKAGLGAEWNEMSSLNKANDIIGGIGGAIGGTTGLIGGLTHNPKDYTLKYADPIQVQTPKVIKAPNDIFQQTNLAMQQVANPQMNLNQVQNPILNQAKLGTKRIKQKNLNRFK